jgi:hypothetical protein
MSEIRISKFESPNKLTGDNVSGVSHRVTTISALKHFSFKALLSVIQ